MNDNLIAGVETLSSTDQKVLQSFSYDDVVFIVNSDLSYPR